MSCNYNLNVNTSVWAGVFISAFFDKFIVIDQGFTYNEMSIVNNQGGTRNGIV